MARLAPKKEKYGLDQIDIEVPVFLVTSKDWIKLNYTANYIAAFDPDTNRILLNRDSYNNSAELQKRIENWCAEGWWPKGANRKFIIYHEIAHSLFVVGFDKSQKKKINRIISRYIKAVGGFTGVGLELGKYANLNKDELLAQAWAVYKTGLLMSKSLENLIHSLRKILSIKEFAK